MAAAGSRTAAPSSSGSGPSSRALPGAGVRPRRLTRRFSLCLRGPLRQLRLDQHADQALGWHIAFRRLNLQRCKQGSRKAQTDRSVLARQLEPHLVHLGEIIFSKVRALEPAVSFLVALQDGKFLRHIAFLVMHEAHADRSNSVAPPREHTKVQRRAPLPKASVRRSPLATESRTM